MTSTYTKHFSARKTDQSEAIPGKPQVKNSAGGYSFEVSMWDRLNRFLVLGSEGGSYYASEQKLTKENAKGVLECIKTDGQRTVDVIVEISEQARAPKNDAAIFALAMCAGLGSDITRRYALLQLPRVCRIGTHLFQFADAIEHFRGWGSGLRKAIARWYTDKDAEKLAYDVTKYVQRGGWAHRDLLRLSHPKGASEDHRKVFGYIVTNGYAGSKQPAYTSAEGAAEIYLAAVNEVKYYGEQGDVANVCNLIVEHRLPREVVPTNMLNEVDVWDAMLQNMPMTAMIRNLAKMTSIGLLKPLSSHTNLVCQRLHDATLIGRAKVHPIQMLSALMTYKQGRGVRGSLTWSPVPAICDALDTGFNLAFGNVVPSNKRTLLALDVSGSMGWDQIAGVPGLTPCDASAAMALVTAAVEPNYHVMAFADRFVPVNITKKDSLDSAIRKVSNLPFGGTDCSLPMVWAQKNRVDVDTFVVYTDSETWCGGIHPCQALKSYRDATGIDARLVVVGMVANNFTIADPSDRGMLDVVGFDTATPQLISDFSSGKI